MHIYSTGPVRNDILFSITFVGYTDMILTFIYTAAIVFDPIPQVGLVSKACFKRMR